MPFPLRKSLLIAIVLAMLALLTLSACGGGDDDDDGGDDGGNDPTATVDSGDDGGDDDGEDATDDTGGDDDGDDDDDGGEDATTDSGFDEDPSELAELACTLLTADEIRDEAGLVVNDGEPSSIEGFADCQWGNPQTFDNVSVSLIAEGGEALYEFNNDDYEEIDDLGDRAQYSGGNFFPLLEVMDDGLYFSITLNGGDLDEAARRQTLIDLAHIALDRLP
jgi:hypothetical protein